MGGCVESDRGKAEEEVGELWCRIYRKYDNDIDMVWNTERKEELLREYEKVKKDLERNEAIKLERVEEVKGMEREYIETCVLEVREHMEVARRVEGGFTYLEEIVT